MGTDMMEVVILKIAVIMVIILAMFVVILDKMEETWEKIIETMIRTDCHVLTYLVEMQAPSTPSRSTIEYS